MGGFIKSTIPAIAEKKTAHATVIKVFLSTYRLLFWNWKNYTIHIHFCKYAFKSRAVVFYVKARETLFILKKSALRIIHFATSINNNRETAEPKIKLSPNVSKGMVPN